MGEHAYADVCLSMSITDIDMCAYIFVQCDCIGVEEKMCVRVCMCACFLGGRAERTIRKENARIRTAEMKEKTQRQKERHKHQNNDTCLCAEGWGNTESAST